MSTALARSTQGLQAGLDPFQHLRASHNFEYHVTRTQDGIRTSHVLTSRPSAWSRLYRYTSSAFN